MAQIHLTYGPPGCGKTTWITRQSVAALERYGSDDPFEDAGCPVLFSSLTRAAAGELKLRGLDVPKEAIGTLHAHAYRGLGRPKMFDDKAIAEFNAYCPQYTLSGDDGQPDRSSKTTHSDRLLAAYHVYRSRLTDRVLWNPDVLRFAQMYETWKRAAARMDFSDLIDEAQALNAAPGNPRVIFVDEAQDHDRAQFRLLRKWAEAPDCEAVVVVGDPDQNLYEWRGSEPEAFYELPHDEANARVLKQSYRVPRAVHALACSIIGRATGHKPVEYLARDADGESRSVGWDMTTRLGAQYTVGQIEEEYLPAGKTVMLLASCEYMLTALCGELKQRGIPFWNPFSRDRHTFNPLHPSHGRSAAERLLDYLRPDPQAWGEGARLWTIAELAAWTEHLEAKGFLSSGAKTRLKAEAERCEGAALSVAELEHYFDADALATVADLSLDWFENRLLSPKRASFKFPLTIARQRGAAALREQPRVTVGTIHSVKGGEADVVYVAPDLSPQGFMSYRSAYPDPVFRQFYVAVTRARETVVLCRRAAPGAAFFNW